MVIFVCRYWPSGSPPRMRGKVIAEAGHHQIGGITPAYAGKSISSVQTENTQEGSPPRMRGKELRVETCFSHDGITPAYAGKRQERLSSRTSHRDHPRVCGEKNACWGVPQTPLGSPPRMRGKGLLQVFIPEPLRITPACAGKRGRPHSGPGTTRDHPRVCGEKSMMSRVVFCTVGSPPRVRGKGVVSGRPWA